MVQRIGVDVGGTNVKIALVSDEGKIIYSNSIPTHAEMGYEYTIQNIITTIKDSLKESNNDISNIGGIGFGLPGQIDSLNGIVRLLPNIPGWVEVPLAKIVQSEFKVPVKLDNDVRVATLGELNFGAGKGCQNLVCLTVGTGVGSGIVIDGKVLRLAEDVISLEGEGELLLEEKLLDFSVEDVLGRLNGRVAAVPVVVEVALQRYSGFVPGPGSLESHLVVPRGRIVSDLGYGVPGAVDPCPDAGGKFKSVGTVAQTETVHRADGLRVVLGERNDSICIVIEELVIVELSSIVVVVNVQVLAADV